MVGVRGCRADRTFALACNFYLVKIHASVSGKSHISIGSDCTFMRYISFTCRSTFLAETSGSRDITCKDIAGDT